MAEYDLGTARGRIELDASGVDKGAGQAASSMDKMTDSQGRASASMARTGAVLLGGSAAIAGGFALAINAAADFETTISGISAVSGATGDQLETIRKKALQLGADTQYSAGEAAGAMEELIKAGLSVDDVLNGAADATVNLAAAGEVDLTTAATIASNAMNAFDLSAQEMPHVADLIAGAANASAIDVGEFGQALQQSGAVAHLVGLSMDDLSVAIAAMGNAGIKGSDAGTSLKSMLMRLQPQTQQQADEMHRLGLITADGANQFFDATGKIKSMSEIAGVLGNALQGMTEEQKLATLQTLFGADAIRAAAVIADTGAAGFDGLAQSMGKVSAADVAKTRMDNLGGSLEQLRGSVETLLITIGRPLADALRGWVDKLTVVVNWLQSLDAGTLHTITTIAGLVGGVLGIVGAIFVAYSAINKIKGAMEALNIVLEANPIILLVTAIALLAYGFYQLYQHNETFREGVQALFGWIQDNVVPIIQDVVDGFQAMISAFQAGDDFGFSTSDGLLGWFIVIGATAREIFDYVIDAWQRFWTVLTTGFTQDEGGAWFENLAFTIRDVGKWIIWLTQTVVAGLVSGFHWMQANVFPVFVALAGLVVAVSQRIIQAWQIVWPFIQVALNLIMTGIKFFIGVVMEAWSLFGDNIVGALFLAFDIIKTVVEAALGVIQGIIQIVTGIISGDWSKAWDGIATILQTVWGLIVSVVQIGIDAISLIIENVLDVIHLAWDTFWSGIPVALQAIWDLITGIISAAVNGLVSIVGSFIDSVVSFFVELPGRILGAIGGLGELLLQKGIDLVNGLWDGIKETFANVLSWFGDLPGRILSALGDLGSMLLDAGKRIIQGLIDGISSMKDAVGDAIGGVASTITDHLPFSPVKVGPLRVLNDGGPGKKIIEMIADGMSDALPMINDSLGRIFLDPTLAINPAVSMLGSGAGATSTTEAPVFHFEFTGPVSDPEAVKTAVTSPDVINKILVAARQGRRAS